MRFLVLLISLISMNVVMAQTDEQKKVSEDAYNNMMVIENQHYEAKKDAKFNILMDRTATAEKTRMNYIDNKSSGKYADMSPEGQRRFVAKLRQDELFKKYDYTYISAVSEKQQYLAGKDSEYKKFYDLYFSNSMEGKRNQARIKRANNPNQNPKLNKAVKKNVKRVKVH